METNKILFKWFYVLFIVVLASIINYNGQDNPVILAIVNVFLIGVASWKVADYYNKFGK